MAKRAATEAGMASGLCLLLVSLLAVMRLGFGRSWSQRVVRVVDVLLLEEAREGIETGFVCDIVAEEEERAVRKDVSAVLLMMMAASVLARAAEVVASLLTSARLRFSGRRWLLNGNMEVGAGRARLRLGRYVRGSAMGPESGPKGWSVGLKRSCWFEKVAVVGVCGSGPCGGRGLIPGFSGR